MVIHGRSPAFEDCLLGLFKVADSILNTTMVWRVDVCLFVSLFVYFIRCFFGIVITTYKAISEKFKLEIVLIFSRLCDNPLAFMICPIS